MTQRVTRLVSGSVFAITMTLRGAPLPEYRSGQLLINTEGYTARRLFGVEWGSGESQVGQRPLHSRGALSYSPRYIAVGPGAEIVIGDEVNQRLLVFSDDGALVSSFPAAYGGYYLGIDDDGRLLTLFRRPLAPFAVAVYEGGKVTEEVEVPPMLRNPVGDRIQVDSKGQMLFQYGRSFQYLTAFTEGGVRDRSMRNYVTGEQWSYQARCRSARLGEQHPGHVSRFGDRVYRIGNDGRLSITDGEGNAGTSLDLWAALHDRLGCEPGVRLEGGHSATLVSDDAEGRIYVLARLRLRTPGKNPWVLVKVTEAGDILLALDCYPCDIHYGTEAQFYPSTIAVTGDGAVYQLCTESQAGVHVIRFAPGKVTRE